MDAASLHSPLVRRAIEAGHLFLYHSGRPDRTVRDPLDQAGTRLI
jgi:hypothetical protein